MNLAEKLISFGAIPITFSDSSGTLYSLCVCHTYTRMYTYEYDQYVCNEYVYNICSNVFVPMFLCLNSNNNLYIFTLSHVTYDRIYL